MIEKLEKLILGKMGAIKRGESTPKDSGISYEMNRMKTLDVALYEKLLNQYKVILTNLKK
ncbi:MAG: hypothetical protein V4714_22475 [Bacteroidota bacterium]